MQQDVRVWGEAAPASDGSGPDRAGEERASNHQGSTAGGARGAPSVTGVPSDQLWRAAVLAAREAATTAAELRQSIERRRREL